MRDITISDLEKIMRTINDLERLMRNEFNQTNRTINEILRLLKQYLPKIK